MRICPRCETLNENSDRLCYLCDFDIISYVPKKTVVKKEEPETVISPLEAETLRAPEPEPEPEQKIIFRFGYMDEDGHKSDEEDEKIEPIVRHDDEKDEFDLAIKNIYEKSERRRSLLRKIFGISTAIILVGIIALVIYLDQG